MHLQKLLCLICAGYADSVYPRQEPGCTNPAEAGRCDWTEQKSHTGT